MGGTAEQLQPADLPDGIEARVESIDWTRVSADLDGSGWALLGELLRADECRQLASLYPDDAHFRSKVIMARHGFGRGEYQYFAYPLPDPIAALRPALYEKLAPIGNRWN